MSSKGITELVAGAIGLAVLVGSAGAAQAAPLNQRTLTFDATCNGVVTTFATVQHANPIADLIAAIPIVGGGAAKTVTLDAYLPGTDELIFSGSTGYPRPAEAECTGTVTEDGFTFDFVIGAVLHGS